MFRYETFLTTSTCTAGCSHCPFSRGRPLMDGMLRRLEERIAATGFDSVFVLTGGEPLEGRDFDHVVKLLQDRGRYFRIATGGHVDLEAFADVLGNEFFTGISVGTDVIQERRNRRQELREIWERNIRYLNHHGHPYSLTTSLFDESDIEPVAAAIKRYAAILKPDFLMALVPDEVADPGWEQLLENTLGPAIPGMPVVINPIEMYEVSDD